MADTVKKCRVCGKEYKACRTARMGEIFRWQDVACSEECGSFYFELVLEGRNKSKLAIEPECESTMTEAVEICSEEIFDESEEFDFLTE